MHLKLGARNLNFLRSVERWKVDLAKLFHSVAWHLSGFLSTSDVKGLLFLTLQVWRHPNSINEFLNEKYKMLDTEKWWQTQLAKDVHSSLRRREIELPVYHSKSPQICYRRFLVNWLALLGEKLDLFQEVVHLAVRYLDHVMDRYELLMESQLNMLAVCCLSLAGRISWYQLFRSLVTLLSSKRILSGAAKSKNNGKVALAHQNNSRVFKIIDNKELFLHTQDPKTAPISIGAWYQC